MRVPRPALATALALALAAGAYGCTYRQTLDRIAPAPEVAFAREILDHLRAGRLDEVRRHLDPALLGPDVDEDLAASAAQFHPGEPRSVELVGASFATGPGRRSAQLSFQYEFDRGWMAASVVLQREADGPLLVRGLHVTRLPDALQRLHAFGFEGKGAVHWLFLLWASLVVGFILVMLVVALRARDLRRRWLWALFVLVGVTGTSLNWTTGQIDFVPLSVHLFGVAVLSTSPYAPWVVTVSFPLGAVAFLVTRLRRS